MRRWFGLICGVWFLVAGGAAAWAECNRSYTIRVTENFTPYFLTSTDGHRSGLEVDFARLVMKLAGCKFEFVQLPWRRALLMVEMGGLDILTVASYTEERAKFGRFSVPYRREVIGLMMRPEDAGRPLQQLSDLHREGLLAVFLGGGYHGPEFKAYMEHADFKKVFRPVTQIYESVPALLHGRIDGIVSDAIAMSEHIRVRGLGDQLIVHDYRIYENDVFFLTSQLSVSQVDLAHLNQAIRLAMRSPDNPFARWQPD